MSDEFKENIDLKPELVFEPIEEEVVKVEVKEEKNEEIIDEINLTE